MSRIAIALVTIAKPERSLYNVTKSSYHHRQSCVYMGTTTAKKLTLEQFLELPETKPASEYLDGEIIQKPMPKGRHSCLQYEICNAVNQVAKIPKIAFAFPGHLLFSN